MSGSSRSAVWNCSIALHGATGVLIATAQQHMSHRDFRVELYSFLQSSQPRILVLREEYQRRIEGNVESRAVQALGAAQLL